MAAPVAVPDGQQPRPRWQAVARKTLELGVWIGLGMAAYVLVLRAFLP